ncbi:MAG: hypothetical protein BIFFINMI_00687 [Phycisphaerae bacterium]|nr:hypothetical protein [Phycisphaerae bacterium]
MRLLPFVILAVVTLVLQLALAPAISLTSASFMPQFPLILAMFVALYARADVALIACWSLGLLLDLSSRGPMGGFAFAFGLVGLGIVNIRASIFRDHPLSHFFLAMVFGVVANEIVCLREAFGSQLGGFTWHHLFVIPAGNAVYTALLAPYLMLLLVRLRRVMDFTERA